LDVLDLTSKKADIARINTMTEASNTLRADAILASHISPRSPAPPPCLLREAFCMKEPNKAVAKYMSRVVIFYEHFDGKKPPCVARRSARPP
jgi:hypothetical protein